MDTKKLILTLRKVVIRLAADHFQKNDTNLTGLKVKNKTDEKPVEAETTVTERDDRFRANLRSRRQTTPSVNPQLYRDFISKIYQIPSSRFHKTGPH